MSIGTLQSVSLPDLFIIMQILFLKFPGKGKSMLYAIGSYWVCKYELKLQENGKRSAITHTDPYLQESCKEVG